MSWTPSDRSAADALREIEALSVGSGTPPSGAAPRPVPTGYAAVTRTATYGFLAALPLFVLYEVGILLATGGTGAVRVGADVWIKTLLASLGATGTQALAVGVLAAGLAVFWSERTRRPAIVPKYFAWIVAEALLYAVVLAYVVGGATAFLFADVSSGAPAALMAQLARLDLGTQLALSIGAGLYEELVFRVLLVGGLALALGRLTRWSRRDAYLVAAVVGAAVFSGVHHVGAYGDPFTVEVFTFRFLFGLALNGVFLVRGFALAAWAHALYDVLVVTGSV